MLILILVTLVPISTTLLIHLKRTMLAFAMKIVEKVRIGTILFVMMAISKMETDVIKNAKLKTTLCVGEQQGVIFVDEKDQNF